MQILLHGSRHDRKPGRWELMQKICECMLIFIEISTPSINLNIHLMRTLFRFIPWSSCMVFHQFEQKILFILQITLITNHLCECSPSLHNELLNNQPSLLIVVSCPFVITNNEKAFVSQQCVGLIKLLWNANIIKSR